MKKTTHVLLAQCLADSLPDTQDQADKTAFCLGSLLSLTEHKDIDRMSCKIEKLAKTCEVRNRKNKSYWRQLGEITSCVADSFTVSAQEHGRNEIDASLENYIENGGARLHFKDRLQFHDFSDIIAFVKRAHEIYVACKRSVVDAVQFILTVCYQVVQGILQVLGQRVYSYM